MIPGGSLEAFYAKIPWASKWRNRPPSSLGEAFKFRTMNLPNEYEPLVLNALEY